MKDVKEELVKDWSKLTRKHDYELEQVLKQIENLPFDEQSQIYTEMLERHHLERLEEFASQRKIINEK